MSSAATTKSKSIGIRLDAKTKSRLEMAAALSNQTLSGFVISTVSRAADRVIEDNQSMRLTSEDRDALMAALEKPPKPNAALKKAHVNHNKRLRTS